MDHAEVVALALRQHGLVTLAQARALGLSDDAVDHLVRTGRWNRIRRGVFIVGAAERTWEQRIMALCLAGGSDVRSSARTAARLWDVVALSGRPQLLVLGDRRVRLSGATVQRTRLLPPMDIAEVRGIPTTSLARTLVDASAGQDERTVGRWIDHAIRMHGLDLAELRSCLARLAGPGRRDVRSIAAALGRRPEEYDPGESDLETRVLEVFEAGGLPTPVVQHPVVRPDGRHARIDLAYPWAMVAFEPEGFQFHRDRTSFDHDRIRASELTLMGWDVYRLTSAMSDAYLLRVGRGALERAAHRLDPTWRAS